MTMHASSPSSGDHPRISRRQHKRRGSQSNMIQLSFVVLLLLLFHHHDHHQTNSIGACNQAYSGLPVACAALTRRQGPLRTGGTDETTFNSSSGSGNSGVAHPPASPSNSNKSLTVGQIVRKAGHKAIGGGIPGMVAGVVQVLGLMWLRTIINYQCRYGTSFRDAFVILYKDGGWGRFYRGMGFALLQTPLSRFGSTAANDGINTLFADTSFGPGRTTVIASLVVGLWRIAIMPLDTCKTVLQVDSALGFQTLWRKVQAGQISALYQGSLAMAISAIMGHFPWFYTYNFLQKSPLINTLFSTNTLLRNAFIGVTASVVSDTVVNSIRVVKTMKQTMGTKHHGGLNYIETIRMILAADGWKGLFGRGLQTRIFANGLQSLVFTVIWRGLADYWRRQAEGRDEEGVAGTVS